MVTDHQHVDNHLVVDHAKAHCDSRESFKGVLDSAAGKFGQAFAKDLKTRVITTLERERVVLLAQLKNDSGLGNINQLRAPKTELTRTRAGARKLI